MTPVTNKQPMPQAPGKGISSFPTPVIDDVVITEIVNAWKGNYTPLEYGVMWDDVPHASMQGSHPDHKLVYQDPASQDGEWIKRIWVNDRVNQDSYNYAIKYSGGSPLHPIYVRTYILPREGYAPLPDGTPDEVYPTAFSVDEETSPADGELNSKYIKVTRVFETLPGPDLAAQSLVDTAVGKVVGSLSTITEARGSVPPSGGYTVLEDNVKVVDSAKVEHTRVTVPGYPELTSYDLDEVLNTVVINERTVINHNDPYSAPPLVLTVTDRPIDQWKTLRITSRLANIPVTRTEYKTQQFTFPALLNGITVTDLDLGFGRIPINDEDSEFAVGINKFVSITPRLRPAISIPTQVKVVTKFFSGPPPSSEISQPYAIVPTSVSYNGSLFNISVGDVLTDAFTVGPIVASDNDTRLSGLSESISFIASIPTYSQYIAQIGQEKPIFCNVDYYKSDIWIVKTGYITLV